MKTKTLLIWIVLLSILVSCQTAAPTPLPSTPTPPGQMETMVVATIYANQTSIAEAERAEKATLTAAIPLPTDTPAAMPTPNAFHFRLRARGCWMNSEISIRAGQTVVIRASGETNTGTAGMGAAVSSTS